MNQLKPVVIDGVLWVSIALFACMQAMLTTEEAYKYCNPTVLFWMKFVVACCGASAGSLKAFRSTTYAAHVEEKKAETAFLKKP